jgi:hypothetical protein
MEKNFNEKLFIPPKEVQESRLVKKPKQLLEELGIVDYRYEINEDGVHFFIQVPREHIEERRKQALTLLGASEPTDFEREKMIPFLQKLLHTKGLDFRVTEGKIDDDSKEIIIFTTKHGIR